MNIWCDQIVSGLNLYFCNKHLPSNQSCLLQSCSSGNPANEPLLEEFCEVHCLKLNIVCCYLAWIVMISLSYPIMSFLVLGKERSYTEFWSLSVLYWKCCHMLTRFSSCFLLTWKGINLSAIRCMFRLSFKMQHTDPNEIHNMSETWQVAIILFSGKQSFSQSTFPSVYFVNEHAVWPPLTEGKMLLN
jgi:hypothetical protein